MAFCPYCGSKIEQTAKFCMECGAKLTPPAPVQEEQTEFVHTDSAPPSPEQPARRARLRVHRSGRKSPRPRW